MARAVWRKCMAIFFVEAAFGQWLMQQYFLNEIKNLIHHKRAIFGIDKSQVPFFEYSYIQSGRIGPGNERSPK